MKNRKSINAICYLEDDYGRDAQMMLPLIYFAEKYLHCHISFKLIWDIHAIYQYKPDLILQPNTIGSKLAFQISKHAHKNNIPVFALISEGNFRTDGSFNYWGYNTDKIFYQEYICHWSERTRQFFNRELPYLVNRNVLTGGVGFDRYKFYKFKSRDSFFNEKKIKPYSKVIGYAGWAFGKLFNKQGFEELSFLHQNDPDKISWLKEQMSLVENILKTVIDNNPDILFILKRHPNEANPSIVGEETNEMVHLKNRTNVLYIRDKESIHDLINISDIWLGYETTTALEAWLMGDKPTILINPDPVFKRDELYKGSLLVKNAEELQSMINEYYHTSEIKAFKTQELQRVRKKLIYDTIGFDDGMNHLRAGYYLQKTIEEKVNGNKISVKLSLRYFIMHLLMVIGKYFYYKNLFKKLPKFKKTIWIFENFRLKNMQNLKKKYYPYMNSFYEQGNISQKIKNNSLWKEIIH
ncbi:MAG: hypothetical protein J7K46_05655 [Bacteroidales bacterium]|nr:hypothetical protein [Bacteroidales bacterium]